MHEIRNRIKMSDLPLISVIVPVYNAEQYLAKCIESILAQTYSNFELLLVDDGSKDASLDCCNNYAKQDNRIKAFTHANSGVSATRNRGIELAQGEYITFVDSDDWIRPDYLQVLYDALQPDLGCGLVIAGLERCYAVEIVPVEIPTILLRQNEISRLVTDFLEERITYSCSKLLSRKIVMENNLRFITNLSCFEDLLFTLDYALHADYVNIINEKIYCYRANDNACSLSVKYNSFEHEMQTINELLHRLNSYRSMYNISDAGMCKTGRTITGFLHKVLLSVYKNNYNSATRKHCLQQLILNHHQTIEKYYRPDYLVDRISASLLKKKLLFLFDIWETLLWGIKFPKMFGA